MYYPLPIETLGYDVKGPFAARSGGTKIFPWSTPDLKRCRIQQYNVEFESPGSIEDRACFLQSKLALIQSSCRLSKGRSRCLPEARVPSLTGVSTPLAISSIMAIEENRFKKSGLLAISSAITVFDSLVEPFFPAVCCTAVADCPKTLQRIPSRGP